MATKGGAKGGIKGGVKGEAKGEINHDVKGGTKGGAKENACEKPQQPTPRPELSRAEVEEMSEWFYFFDKDNNKKLDKEELKRVFHAMCWSFTDKEVDDIFKTADTDDNGFIDYEEYLNLLQTFRKDPYTERLELIEAFRHFDQDRSGYIDGSELRRFLLTKGMAYSDRDRREVDNMLKRADQNGDGKIDIEEFVDLMLEKPGPPKSKF